MIFSVLKNCCQTYVIFQIPQIWLFNICGYYNAGKSLKLVSFCFARISLILWVFENLGSFSPKRICRNMKRLIRLPQRETAFKMVLVVCSARCSLNFKKIISIFEKQGWNSLQKYGMFPESPIIAFSFYWSKLIFCVVNHCGKTIFQN